MNIFLLSAPDYYENNLIVTPVHPTNKYPLIKNWQKKETYNDIDINKYKQANIGLLCGAINNIVVVDIDETDPEMLKKIADIMPDTPVKKRGNKLKGLNYFYQYNNQRSEKIGPIDILSDGRQTVIPDSMHGLGYPYRWIGRPILEVDIDDLPILHDWVLDDLRLLYPDKSKKTHGRNNALVTACTAKIAEGKDPTTIIQELIEYDSTFDKPLFSDHLENKTDNPVINATRFYASVFQSAGQAQTSWESEKHFDIVETQTTTLDYKRKKLPKFRGVMQEMFDYIYANSPVPRTRLCVASVLSTMSVLCGNKIRFGNIFPNLYTMIIAPSGAGKDYPLKFPTNLLSKSRKNYLLGDGAPASDTGLVMNLDKQKVRIDVIDEAAVLFAAINDKNVSYLQKMSDTYAKLYTSVGSYFSGKNAVSYQVKGNDKGNKGECWSPYVVMLCAITIKDFKNCFNQNTIDKGLGGRFLYFPDDEKKKINYMLKPQPIPAKLLDFVELIEPKTDIVDWKSPVDEFDIPEITATSKAQEFILSFGEELDKQQQSCSEQLAPLYNRLFVTFIKIAILDAVSTSFTGSFSNITLTLESLNWSKSFILAYINSVDDFLRLNVVDNPKERIFNDFEEAILLAGPKGITTKELGRRHSIRKHGMLSNGRKQIIQTLVDDEIIFFKKIGKKVTFFHQTYVKENAQ